MAAPTVRDRGFTLLELLMVVAVIAIIAAIATSSLLHALDRGRQKGSLSDMRSIGMALSAYSLDQNYYPLSTSMQTLTAIGPAAFGIEPVYIKQTPTLDGWGRPFYYGSDAAGLGTDFTLLSLGKDGKRSVASSGPTSDFDCDLIYQNGTFVSYPEGVQT